jgi:hypothetical protein
MQCEYASISHACMNKLVRIYRSNRERERESLLIRQFIYCWSHGHSSLLYTLVGNEMQDVRIVHEVV